MLAIVLLAALGAAFFIANTPRGAVRIYQDGVLIDSFDLYDTERRSFAIENDAGGINIISVEYGRIRISEANCPDGLCVRQGWISGGTRPIVCLPHRLVINLEGDFAVDAVVG